MKGDGFGLPLRRRYDLARRKKENDLDMKTACEMSAKSSKERSKANPKIEVLAPISMQLNSTRLCLLFVFLLVVLTLESYPAPTWKGLTPLVSTRADVERVLNASDPTMDVLPIYFSKWGMVHVRYSNGKCADSKENKWDVVKDTVLDLSIYPKEPLFPADLGFDLTKFIKIRGATDLPGTFLFRNLEDGLAYDLDENTTPNKGTVTGYSYFPARTDDHLRCP